MENVPLTELFGMPNDGVEPPLRCGRSGPVEYQTNVTAQSEFTDASRLTVKLLKMEELEIVLKSQRYAVGVKSTLPIVVQQTRRSLVKGGTPSSKSRKPLASVSLANIFATMAVPVREL